MSNGTKIQLNTAFTDTSMPVIRNDRRLTHGSLVLLSPTHGLANWPAGVPANGAALPNLAAEDAARLGISDPSIGAMVISGEGVVFERTGKGGLHGAVPRAASAAATAGMTLNAADWLRSYLLANPTHRYYLHLLGRTTRLTAGSGNSLAYAGFRVNRNSGLQSFLAFMNNDSVAQSVLGRRGQMVTATEPQFRNLATAGQGIDSFVSAESSTFAQWGRRGNFNGSAADAQRLPSWIFYEAYLEDMDVSGRNYAEIDELCFEVANSYLAEGGKFYDDTFTDPAALAP